MQRVQMQTRRGLPIRLTIFSGRASPSRVRFFPGADVLRFIFGLLHFIRPGSPQ